MKLIPFLLNLGIILLSFMSMNALSDAQKPMLRLTTGLWEPFTGSHLPHFGTGAHKVEQAFAAEGIGVEFSFRPWKRAFLEAKSGAADGSVFWRITPERLQSFYFSDPVVKDEVVFFHLKSNPFEWRSLEDLKSQDIQIGIIIGFNYETNFDNIVNAQGFSVQRVATQEQNLKKLFLKRIGIAPLTKESGYATINKLFSKEDAALFTHHPLPLKKNTYHLILTRQNRHNEQIIKLFNKGLKQLAIPRSE